MEGAGRAAWRTLIVVLGVALGAGTGARAEEGVPDTWYAERVSSGDAPVRVEHFWSKGDWLRAEGVFAGHPIVTLVKGDRYVILDRLTGEGISIGRSDRAIAEDAQRERPFGNELHVLLASGGEKVRDQELPSGGSCELFRLTDEKGRREVCVSPEGERLPILLEVWIRASGRSMQTRYVEWARGIAIPDGFFDPPPDAKLEHVSYTEYVKRSSEEQLGPAPPLHGALLHGY